MTVSSVVIDYISHGIDEYRIIQNIMDLKNTLSLRSIHESAKDDNVFTPYVPILHTEIQELRTRVVYCAMNEHFRRVGEQVVKLLKENKYDTQVLLDRIHVPSDVTHDWELNVTVYNSSSVDNNVINTTPTVDQRALLQRVDALLRDIQDMMKQPQDNIHTHSDDLQYFFDTSVDAIVPYDETKAMEYTVQELAEPKYDKNHIMARIAHINATKNHYEQERQRIKQLQNQVDEQANKLLSFSIVFVDEEMNDDYETKIDSLKDVCELIITPSESAVFASTKQELRHNLVECLHFIMFGVLFPSYEEATREWAKSIVSDLRSFILSKTQFLNNVAGYARENINYDDEKAFSASVGAAQAILVYMQQNSDTVVNQVQKICRLCQDASGIAHVWYLNELQDMFIDHEAYTGYQRQIQYELETLALDILDIDERTELVEIENTLLKYGLFLVSEYIGKQLIIPEPTVPVPLAQNSTVRASNDEVLLELFTRVDWSETSDVLRLMFKSVAGARSAYLEQVLRIVESYPLHSLGMNETVPYLHPIMNKQALVELFSDDGMQADRTVSTGKAFGSVVQTVAECSSSDERRAFVTKQLLKNKFNPV
jgi:hypothetical protein